MMSRVPQLNPSHRTIFFKLMEERYRQHSTIITTILGYEVATSSATAPWWRRSWRQVRTIAIPYTSKVRRCASRKVEEGKRGGQSHRPERIYPPGAQRLPPDTGTVGTIRRPDRLLAPNLCTPGTLPPAKCPWVLAASRRLLRPTDAPPLGTIRSLAYFLPVIGRGARAHAQPRLLSNTSAVKIAGFYSNASNPPPSPLTAIDSGASCRSTPSAWDDNVRFPPLQTCHRTPSAWMMMFLSLTPTPGPNARSPAVVTSTEHYWVTIAKPPSPHGVEIHPQRGGERMNKAARSGSPRWAESELPAAPWKVFLTRPRRRPTALPGGEPPADDLAVGGRWSAWWSRSTWCGRFGSWWGAWT